MKPRIETLSPKKLVGIRQKMSLVDNRTRELWRKFMPRRSEVERRINSHYFSMQVYDHSLAQPYSPTAFFEKWAAVEVADFEKIPREMEAYTLPGGQYAVFVHRGPAREFSKTLKTIYERWLPHSGYELDDREHFEILGEGYRPDDPEAEEEFWVPIKLKKIGERQNGIQVDWHGAKRESRVVD